MRTTLLLFILLLVGCAAQPDRASEPEVSQPGVEVELDSLDFRRTTPMETQLFNLKTEEE